MFSLLFQQFHVQPHFPCWARCAAISIISIGCASTAFSGSLTFDETLSLSAREAPALRASLVRIDAARQSAIPAGELPDPRLALGIDNLPIEGPDRYSLTDDFMTMQRIGLMQEFPNRAKRAARMQAAAARVDLMKASERLVRQTILRETALAWIARNTTERQLAVLDRLSMENKLFEEAVRARFSSGSGVATEIVMPRQEAAMIEERRDVLLARHAQAIAQLRRWIGDSANQPLSGDVPQWSLTRDSLLHRLHQHPELAAFGPRAHVLDAEAAEAKAGKRPDWALELAYQRRGPRFSDMVMVQVSFDLPVFAGTRQDPLIAARESERRALDAEREAALREHAAALEGDFAEYQRLQQEESRLSRVLLPLADEKAALALAAWRSGKGALADLIVARREHIETQLKAVVVAGERQQMGAHLYYSYGDAQVEASGEQQ